MFSKKKSFSTPFTIFLMILNKNKFYVPENRHAILTKLSFHLFVSEYQNKKNFFFKKLRIMLIERKNTEKADFIKVIYNP